MVQTTVNPTAESGNRPTITWDVNTALAVVVLSALLFLFLMSRGFRGHNVSLSA